MAQIFLSYAREDRPRASILAVALERCGWSVWWDRQIPYGRDFRAYTQEQLDRAACVVVLWSSASVESQFVRDEASEGLNRRLVPALLEPDVKPPLSFRQLQAANLSSWRGETLDEEFVDFVKSIEAIVPRPVFGKSVPEIGAPTALKGDSAQVVHVTDNPGFDSASSPDATPTTPTERWTHRSITRLSVAGVAVLVVVLATIFAAPFSRPKTCEQGVADDCFAEGRRYANGTEGRVKDPARGAALFQKACDGGSADGCNRLGIFYANGGGGLSKDLARAVALYQKACDLGDGFACHNLGFQYSEGGGGLTKDEARAAALYQKACDGTSLVGCTNLGLDYAFGRGGLSKDLTRAVALFEKACDAGHAPGCYNLGVNYHAGDGGLAKDEARAVALYQKACDGGHMPGCYNRAVALYQKACEGGAAAGCSSLGSY